MDSYNRKKAKIREYGINFTRSDNVYIEVEKQTNSIIF